MRVESDALDATRSASARDSKPGGAHVTRGALAFLSTQPITWATSLAVAALVPRYLGDTALGQYGVASGIAALVSSIASLGLQNYLTRRVAIDPARAAAYAWSASATVAAGSLLLGAAMFAVAALTNAQNGIDLVVLASALGGGLVSVVQGVFSAILIGSGRNARAAWTNAATLLLTVAVGLGTLAAGGGVREYAVAYLAGWLVATVALMRSSGLALTRSAFSRVIVRELVEGGLPFLGWNIALRVRGGLDVIITGILLQTSVAGWLVAAYRIIGIAIFVPTVVTTPLMPALSRAKGDLVAFRQLLGQSLSTVMFLTVPIAASILALAPSIPGLIGWPESLEHAVPVMMILAFQQPLIAVDMVLGVGLIALGRERAWLRVAIVGAVLNPLMNLIGIPLAHAMTGNGAIGAALVELATEIVFLGGALVLTPRSLLGRDDLSVAARTVIAGCALVAVATAVRPASVPIAFVAGGTAYLLTAAALGVIGPRQLRAVRLALRPT